VPQTEAGELIFLGGERLSYLSAAADTSIRPTLQFPVLSR